MQGKYRVITLCGSTRFRDQFLEVQKRLTLEGNIVISVGLFGHAGDNEVWTEGTKEMLDDMHKRKIDMSDGIYVINVGGYIGDSTRSEIEYAKRTGKSVRYLEEPDETKRLRDAVRGCLLGGAVGDALGYPVEFMREDKLFAAYGDQGIRRYEYDPETGKALISDDTQMVLFTVEAILNAAAESTGNGGRVEPQRWMARSYFDWYKTQQGKPLGKRTEKDPKKEKDGFGRLLDIPELYHRRAPGNTCLDALYRLMKDQPVYNHSKGCGGIMRVAPLGLYAVEQGPVKEMSKEEILAASAEEGEACAALTHGHSLGYMPSAMLADLIRRIVFYREGHTLKELVMESEKAMAERYSKKPAIHDMLGIVDRAMALAENGQPDRENIHALGEGWVAEETLAIAVYCALRYQDDFSAGIIASVNHQGDSDSTGAVAGNILGAWLGFDAIDEQWKKDLELYPLIIEMADRLVP